MEGLERQLRERHDCRAGPSGALERREASPDIRIFVGGGGLLYQGNLHAFILPPASPTSSGSSLRASAASRWAGKGIEATMKVAESPNAKVIVIGAGKDGLPLILGGQ